MNATATLNIYEILQPIIKNEQKTKELVQNIEIRIDEKFENKKEILATKEDIANVKKDIAEAKADQIKWSFIFWTGTVITVLGGLLAILKIFFQK